MDADCVLTGCSFTVWYSGVPWGVGQDDAVEAAGRDVGRMCWAGPSSWVGPSERWSSASVAWAQSLKSN